ncbi:hypothetical protein [Thalassobellus suaedae]|uniref:Uncharacterized protein n=1 Tax=Thalassobellus suaedae TaxID=3074124 RepID=A0ABY9XY56_9FLAO|nr:hypothetical protein RHP51_09340 [Flavobacteriaceae bacterium HL-DH14]
MSQGYFIIGFVVIATGFLALAIKFSSEDEEVPSVSESLTGDLQPIKVKS